VKGIEPGRWLTFNDASRLISDSSFYRVSVEKGSSAEVLNITKGVLNAPFSTPFVVDVKFELKGKAHIAINCPSSLFYELLPGNVLVAEQDFVAHNVSIPRGQKFTIESATFVRKQFIVYSLKRAGDMKTYEVHPAYLCLPERAGRAKSTGICPDCKGRGKITLLTTTVDCTRCQSGT
jgi:hypothetical protein